MEPERRRGTGALGWAHARRRPCERACRARAGLRAEGDALLAVRLRGELVEREQLRGRVAPLGRRLRALRGALPEALVGYLDTHHEREPQDEPEDLRATAAEW